MAERKGFEPLRPFWSLHAFQACAFDRSAISPRQKNKGEAGLANEIVKNGGDERDRTADLLIANETLSQLSYIPTVIIWLCAGLP